MATLPTYGFNVRALPRLAEIDPRDFRGGVPDFQAGFQGSLANIEGILRNMVLDEQAKSTKRKGALEEIEQPSKEIVAKTEAESRAKTVGQEQAIRELGVEDTMTELPEVREQRQAERDLATQRAVTGKVQTTQARRSSEAIDNQIEAMAQAKAAAELAGDKTAAERAAQELVTLGARRDDLVRNAQLASQAERGQSQSAVEQARNAAFQSRIAQLPKKQRIVLDADGNQKIEGYVEEPQADGSVRVISLGDSGITPKEDVELKREALKTKIDSDAALAAQRAANAEAIRSGKPVSKEVKGFGGETVGFVSVRVNPQTGDFEVSPMVTPGKPASAAEPAGTPGEAVIPTFTVKQAESAPPGLFRGTDGNTYRKNTDGSIVLAQ